MTTAERTAATLEQPVEKGLKSGALGLFSATAGFGSFLSHLLLLMVLSSAAASTQTTTLPTARTTLSMAACKALPDSFAKTHPRYMTPTVSTIAMGGISIVLYVAMNYLRLLPDHQARVLQKADPDQGHTDPHP